MPVRDTEVLPITEPRLVEYGLNDVVAVHRCRELNVGRILKLAVAVAIVQSATRIQATMQLEDGLRTEYM